MISHSDFGKYFLILIMGMDLVMLSNKLAHNPKVKVIKLLMHSLHVSYIHLKECTLSVKSLDKPQPFILKAYIVFQALPVISSMLLRHAALPFWGRFISCVTKHNHAYSTQAFPNVQL